MPSSIFEFDAGPSATLVRANARLVRFTGLERVSRPYRFDLVLVARRGVDDPALELLGARGKMWMHLGESSSESRVIHGVVERVDLEGRPDADAIESSTSRDPRSR